MVDINPIAAARPSQITPHTRPEKKGIRVEPVSDIARKLLRHPRAGGFRSVGSVNWPDDTFTRRRLRDGSVKLAEQQQPQDSTKQPQPDPAANPQPQRWSKPPEPTPSE